MLINENAKMLLIVSNAKQNICGTGRIALIVRVPILIFPLQEVLHFWQHAKNSFPMLSSCNT